MKNGSVLTGRVKAFDPTQSITLVVAGITTTIPMSEVQTVESQDGSTIATGSSSASTTQAAEASSTAPAIGGSLGSQKLIITDRNKYPASIKLNVGGQVFNLILVRGGRMNMGYDGDGSRKMKSEPVHEVALTSYYMSDKPLPASLPPRPAYPTVCRQRLNGSLPPAATAKTKYSSSPAATTSTTNGVATIMTTILTMKPC